MIKDVDVKHTQTSNILVANFTLAVNRRIKKEGQQTADFINIIAWGKTGEFCSKYFKKGQQVSVIGRLQTRNYEDNKGQKHYVTEVIAEEVYFADSKKETAENNNLENQFGNEIFNANDDSDLPF